MGDASTTEIARNKDAQGFGHNQVAAVEGGTVAGNARRELEQKSGRRVSSRENFKEIPEAVKKKQIKFTTAQRQVALLTTRIFHSSNFTLHTFM